MHPYHKEEVPLVSVWMITYNHEKYIRQSLESVVSQKTNFKFEVIIGEDCSTDGTCAIVKEFADKYPDIIKPVYQEKNVGAMRNAYEFCYPKLKGKYVACIEGDDYWTDKNKLQTQVNFLETHPDYSICFHSVYELKNEKTSLLQISPNEQTYSIEDLSKENLINTASVLFRNNPVSKWPDWFMGSYIADYFLHLLNARFGKIKYLPTPMSVYRIHSAGVYGGKSFKFRAEKLLVLFKDLIKEFSDIEAVNENLRYQYAFNAASLAEVSIREGNRDEYVKYLGSAFSVSEKFLNKWLLDTYDKNQEVTSSRALRAGKVLLYPFRKIKGLLTRNFLS
ncbi:MAG: glycosyltransferase [Segetibacter sp.]|nr:glycosyltransferase [Segetibacter sp.]